MHETIGRLTICSIKDGEHDKYDPALWWKNVYASEKLREKLRRIRAELDAQLDEGVGCDLELGFDAGGKVLEELKARISRIREVLEPERNS